MFFSFFFLEKTARGEPSLQLLLPLGFLSCLFFFTCPLASIRDTCPNFLGGQTQPLRDPLGRQLLSRCVLGPGNHEMHLQERLWSHVWEMLHPSFSSWIFQCPLGCQKYQETLQGRHMFCFVFNLGFPQIISLLDSPPHPHKNS